MARDQAGPVAGRAPAVEEAVAGGAGEEAKQGSAGGGGHVLAGGVVAGVERGARNFKRKGRKRAKPGLDLAGTDEVCRVSAGGGRGGNGGFDAISFLATSAFIDQERLAGSGETADELGFEFVTESLIRVLARTQADADARRAADPRQGGGPGAGVDAEDVAAPLDGELRERRGGAGARGAAFKKKIADVVADRDEAELGEPAIGVQDEGAGGKERGQGGRGFQAVAQGAGARVGSGDVAEPGLTQEEFGVLGVSREVKGGVRKGAARGINKDARYGDVGAKGDAG